MSRCHTSCPTWCCIRLIRAPVHRWNRHRLLLRSCNSDTAPNSSMTSSHCSFPRNPGRGKVEIFWWVTDAFRRSDSSHISEHKSHCTFFRWKHSTLMLRPTRGLLPPKVLLHEVTCRNDIPTKPQQTRNCYRFSAVSRVQIVLLHICKGVQKRVVCLFGWFSKMKEVPGNQCRGRFSRAHVGKMFRVRFGDDPPLFEDRVCGARDIDAFNGLPKRCNAKHAPLRTVVPGEVTGPNSWCGEFEVPVFWLVRCDGLPAVWYIGGSSRESQLKLLRRQQLFFSMDW